MAGLINNLLDVLEKQAENYDNLLALSQEKRQVLVADDIESLQKITNVENILVGSNQKLERKRIDLIKDIATVLGKKQSDLTLSLLTDLMVGQEEHRALVHMLERLRTTVTQLKETNDANKEILAFSMDLLEFNMNILRGVGAPTLGGGSDGSFGVSSLFEAQQ